MFAHALRAVILLGILGWYSTGVWKMIDNYFKDRFEKYLREEFTKNPKIKLDLDTHRAKNKKIDVTIETTSNLIRTESNKETVDYNNKNKDKSTVEVNLLHSIEFSDGKTYSGENRENLISEKTKNCNKIDPSKNVDNIKIFQQPTNRKSVKPLQSATSKPIKISSTINTLKKKKKKINTITFTDQDFRTVKIKASVDDDFSEFEYEENNGKSSKKVPGGINIADLPFKPKADLGHLNIITEDEYCPINLDHNEKDCQSTRQWS